MKLPLYQIDAFTDTLFKGNPACVVPLQTWLPDETLLHLAKENAVAETAFFIDHGDTVHLRWFTPEIEMDLCGHATLATAHVLKTELQDIRTSITFETLSGPLKVMLHNDDYILDFPARMPMPATLPVTIREALSIAPTQVLKSRDFVLVYERESDIKNIRIDRQVFDEINLDPGGVVVTAPGDEVDFVSRFFTPQASILEDPVTGSAHCSLAPYWHSVLQKDKMQALQLSSRGGKLACELKANRVLLSGQARTYSKGHCWIA